MKRIRIIVFLLILFGINSCTKDELSSKDNNFSIQKQQKFNPDEGYPFVLTEADAPFQFAVYQQDEDILFSYIESILEEQDGMENPGYFILSLNSEGSLIYYGFITETSSYYDPDIFIDNPDDPFIVINDDTDDDIMYCCNKIKTKSKEKFDKWVERKINQGREVTMWKEGDFYCGIASKKTNY